MKQTEASHLNAQAFAASRRQFLYGTGASLGAVAFASMMAEGAKADGDAGARKINNGKGKGGEALHSPLAVKKPHHKPRAKACIMLFMEGGPSHIDTFDPKPTLAKLHMKPYINNGEKISGMTSGSRFYVKSPYQFVKAGRAGIEMCEHFKHLSKAEVADELCVYRGCQGESVNHPTALYHMNTGNRLAGDPAFGAWATYGLGSINQNLPGYVVMTELAAPQGGSGNWSNGYLPAHYQGTQLRSEGSAILDIKPPAWKTRKHQRQNLDALRTLNEQHQKKHPQHAELSTRMVNYELAYRMQMQVPDLMDISKEPKRIREMYGLEDKETAAFGRKCLLARRLIEKGVRFVQIFSGGWDSHDFIERAHKKRIYSIDKPMAALIKDLKERGMLDETMVTWMGEFGRTPGNNRRGGELALGRDHNADAMAMLFAGGGFKRGATVGATDEIGKEAVEVAHPIRDVHVTMLRQLGLDDNKLTYFHGGRFKQLSQFGGTVIKEIVG